MKFTLTYEGDLPSAGNNSKRVREKWQIRKALHPQLEELWLRDPILSRVAKYSQYGFLGDLNRFQLHHSKSEGPPPPDTSITDYTVDLCAPIFVGSGKFIPIVRESLALVCALDILFLRKEEPGALISSGGDLDNRVKTLFDSLRIPTSDEMQTAPADIPNPFYCLLQEDSLISDLAVKTDRLLSKSTDKASEVKLIIQVTVRVTQAKLYNIPFIA
jgi:hypothetical protein